MIRSTPVLLLLALLFPAELMGGNPTVPDVAVRQQTPGDTPESTVRAFLMSLRQGEVDLDENSHLVLSRFCPETKRDFYLKGLTSFAETLEGAETQIEGQLLKRGDFAGCLVAFRHLSNPLDLRVRPLCLLRSENKWKVAAGLSHFQNTAFGFERERHRTARQMAKEIQESARKLEVQLLQDGLRVLRETLAASRAKQGILSREGVIRHFFDCDAEGDGVGKLACLRIPENLSPRNLGHLLSLVSEPQYLAGAAPKSLISDGTEGESTLIEERELTEPIFVILDAKKKQEQYCHVVGLIHPHDPSDYYTAPFYLMKVEERWVIIPHQFQLHGLPSPDSRLVEWYDENQWEWTADLVQKAGEQEGERGEVSAKAAHAAFLRAVREGEVRAALRLLELPPKGEDVGGAEVFDGLEDFWKFARGVAASSKGTAGTMIKTVETVEDGDASVSLHAAFRPRAAGKNMLALQRTQAVRSEGRWYIRLWEDSGLPVQDEGLEATLRRLRRATRVTDPKKRHEAALAFIDLPWTPAEKSDTAQESDVDKLERAARDLLDDVRANQTAAVLARTVLPPGEQSKRGERALGEVADLVLDVADAEGKCDPRAVTVADSWGGVILPMAQPEREDGRVPARLLLFARRDGAWTWVPGMQFFREVNRGYKALNTNVLQSFKDDLSSEDWKSIERLRAVLKATEEVIEESKNDA